MRLVRKYRVADAVDRLPFILKKVAELTRFAKATGNQSLGRLAEETHKTCAAMKGADKETAAALVVQIIQMLKQLSTASNRGVFDDATTAQLERNYNAAMEAVKSSLADYLKARRIRVKTDADYAKARKTHVKADVKSLVDAIIPVGKFIWHSPQMADLNMAVKAANNSELKKRWEDFLFAYSNLAVLAGKLK